VNSAAQAVRRLDDGDVGEPGLGEEKIRHQTCHAGTHDGDRLGLSSGHVDEAGLLVIEERNAVKPRTQNIDAPIFGHRNGVSTAQLFSNRLPLASPVENTIIIPGRETSPRFKILRYNPDEA
jgi:hypothetical protein